MERVVIGVDPHKLSATIEVVDHQEHVLGSGRFTTDKAGFAAMRKYVKRWREREWAVEGSLGVGRPLAQRLLEAGERVVDVPAKLAARARLLDTGHGRKTDAHDADSVAVAAVRAKDLRVLAPDGQLEALRMLADHRDQLSNQRVASVNRLHRLLSELTPGPGEEGHHCPAGKGDPRQRPASRRRREDPPHCHGRAGQPDDNREEGQGPHH
jgi:transposase